MKKIIIPIVLLAMLAGGIWLVQRNRRAADTGTLRVSGNIEITDAALSFKIAGRVAERHVSEGGTVKKGDLVAKLDDTDLQQESALRRAELDVAKAALAELVAGSRPDEIGQAEAVVRRAKAEESRWNEDYQRQQKLYDRNVISQRELESARLAYETSHARVVEAEKALKLVREGPRVERIDQARAQVRKAEEALAVAETRLGYATLTSPMDGIVLSDNIEAGEYVSPGTPVVTVGKMDTVWLRAFVDETDLGKIRVGQDARIRTDTFPGTTYDGKISFISSESEFTPKTVQTDKERVKLVYRIKIDVANPQMQLKPGMPADGEIVPLNAR